MILYGEFIKKNKKIILSSSIFTGISSNNIFSTDENKKNIDIVIKYKGFDYKASNIEVIKNSFVDPEKRIEFIKNNKDKFICCSNKLNFKDSIIEQSIIGLFDGGYVRDGKDEFPVDDLSICFSNLSKATITIEDSAELKYIRTDKKFKFQSLEDAIENGIVKYSNSRENEIDKKYIIDRIKALIKVKCKIDVNDDIFVFDKNADNNGKIKESCTLKINFPDCLIEGNPDEQPTKDKDKKNNTTTNNNNGGTSSESSKKNKGCSGS